ALGDTKAAVDTGFRVDNQEIGAFMETVCRADIDTVGVLAADAVLGNDKGHGSLLNIGRQLSASLGKRGWPGGGSGRSVQFRDGPAGQFSYIRVRIIEGGHHVRPAIVVGDGAECADGG